MELRIGVGVGVGVGISVGVSLSICNSSSGWNACGKLLLKTNTYY